MTKTNPALWTSHVHPDLSWSVAYGGRTVFAMEPAEGPEELQEELDDLLSYFRGLPLKSLNMFPAYRTGESPEVHERSWATFIFLEMIARLGESGSMRAPRTRRKDSLH